MVSHYWWLDVTGIGNRNTLAMFVEIAEFLYHLHPLVKALATIAGMFVIGLLIRRAIRMGDEG